MADDDVEDYAIYLGFGSMHDLRDNDTDPRNPRLIGLRSASYDAAVALNNTPRETARHRIGFHRPTTPKTRRA